MPALLLTRARAGLPQPNPAPGSRGAQLVEEPGMAWHGTAQHSMARHGTLTRAAGGGLHPVGVPSTFPALPQEPPVFACSRVALGEGSQDTIQRT